MKLKVQLPDGEVVVTVEPNSTPGMLKENLKYNLQVPPKCITLKSEGRILDDIKPLDGEVNRLQDGAIIEYDIDRSHLAKMDMLPADQPKKEKVDQPVMIKKEEPPKPKKPKKDVVRPTLGEKDVVKKKTLAPGHTGWATKAAYLEEKSKVRHMAMLKIVAVDEDNKAYPEQQEESVHIVLGDPQTSPVWTEVVKQLEIGENAQFTMMHKVVDFDPEGLCPTDASNTWNVELVRVFDVKDINEDFQQLLQISETGDSQRAEDLDRVSVHWRVRRWMAEGMFVIASSRERIAIMPGYGLVPIEDTNAPPVTISVGEGTQEAVEIVAMALGKGGKGSIFLKSTALPSARPSGCVVLDVELVELDNCKGPKSAGWKGWASLMYEIEQGDRWLEEADERRKQLETFDTMRKTTDDTVGAIGQVADMVHKYANNATRRFTRARQWLGEDEKQDSNKVKMETANCAMKLAKAKALAFQRFGPESEKKAGDEEKKALGDARALLEIVLKAAEEMEKEQLKYDCLKMSLQIAIQAESVPDGKKILEQLQAMRPGDESLKSDSARLNRLTTAMDLKSGAGDAETLQLELRAAIEVVDKDVILEKINALFELMKNNAVKYDDVKTLKVGKDVGNAMKLGDADMAKAGRAVVGEIQRLAKQAELGL